MGTSSPLVADLNEWQLSGMPVWPGNDCMGAKQPEPRGAERLLPESADWPSIRLGWVELGGSGPSHRIAATANRRC
jgi:hypothetical protein